jgi:hypothetical protein
LSTCIGRYPGYLGPNDLSGSKVTVAFDGDDGEDMFFKYNLKGAVSGCTDCGIHIHTGTTCDDKDLVGGHYWDPDKTIDLWTTAGGTVYNTPATATSTTGSFSLNNGFDVEGNDSHAVVVHDSTGARYGCGVLSTSRKAAKGCKTPKKPKSIVLEACVDKYPDYVGSLDISGKIKARYHYTSSGKVTVEYNLKGADKDCETCGLHIHTGTTCDDEDLVGGHYWDSSKVEDPWTTDGGAIYTSESDGKAKGKFTLNAGYDVVANDGHAVVVHDKATGDRYGCGVLSASKKLNGSCK